MKISFKKMNKILILTFFFIHFFETNNCDELKEFLPKFSNNDIKNLKIEEKSDSIQFQIEKVFVNCPISYLNPSTFVFLRKNSIDILSRVSVNFEETKKINENEKNKNLYTKKNYLICKFLSKNLNKEYGNFTLVSNSPNDNKELNAYLSKYFNSKIDHSADIPKIIKRSNHYIKKQVGEKAIFHCDVKPNSFTNIVWYKNKNGVFKNLNKFKSSNIKIKPKTLIIQEITDDDSGDYICRACNNYGEDFASFKLEIYPIKQYLKPRIDSFQEVKDNKKKTVVLNCSFTSHNSFQIKWFKKIECKSKDCLNPKHLFYFKDNNIYYEPLNKSNSFLIKNSMIQYIANYNLNKSDSINDESYVCMISNENGMDFKILNINYEKSFYQLSNQLGNQLNLNYIFLIPILVTVLMVSLILTVFLVQNSKNKKKLLAKSLNKLNSSSSIGQRVQNDYLFNSFGNEEIQKNINKSSSLLINNLIEKGHSSKSSCTKNCLNYSNKKLNLSKLSSLANSNPRITNTPILDDPYDYW